MVISESLWKSLARSEAAEPTITYPLLLKRPMIKREIKNNT
jgi:hypothetical protein